MPERWDAAGLFASAGYSPAWASPAEQLSHLSSQSPLAPPALTWPCLACPWVQGWLQWLLSEGRLQEGPPQLGSSKCAVPPSLHKQFPSTGWKLKCASSQTMCFGSWLVHSLAPFGDPWQTKQGAITSLICFSDEARSHYFSRLFLNSDTFCRHTKDPQRCWETPVQYSFSDTGLPGMDCVCLALFYIVFLFSAALMVCSFKPCVFSPWRGREICNKSTGRQLPVLHPPHSLIPPLVSFLPGSIIWSVVG